MGKAAGLPHRPHTLGYPPSISFPFWKLTFAFFHLLLGLGGGELGLSCVPGVIAVLASLGWPRALKALGLAQVRLVPNSKVDPFYSLTKKEIHVIDLESGNRLAESSTQGLLQVQ